MVFSFFINKKYNILSRRLIIITIFLISFCSSVITSSSSSSSSFRMGFPAPNFTLKTVEGETFSLEDCKGKQKLLILYFYDNENNKDSIRGIEELVQYFEGHTIAEKYRVIIIMNGYKDGEEDIRPIKEFQDNKGRSFTILLDNDKEVNNLYKVEVFPTTIFLDNNLVVKRIYPGLIPEQQNIMFQYLSYFLSAQEKVVAKKEKKDEGCEGGVCPPPPGY